MQRITLAFLIFLVSGALSSASGQTHIKNLKEYTSKPRVFKPIGCKYTDVLGHEHQNKVVVNNYDMEPSIARSDTFDIVHFDVDLDVTRYTQQQLYAHCGISLNILENGAESVRFDLVDLTVDSVFVDGTASTFSHIDGELQIPAPGGTFSEGANHYIDVHYYGHPDSDPYWGGVYWAANYIYHMGIGLTTIPPNFGRVWHPCFDNFVERSTYTWNVRSSGGRKAHLQGTFIGETFEEGDTLTRSFTLEHPITTHQAAFSVSNYVDSNYVYTSEYGDIPVRLTAKPEDIDQMVNKFAELGYAIDACEYWYGPYAWERVGYVLTTDGALEIPTNIAYPRFMIEENIAANSDLLTHELGHQWWGNIVAPYIHNHMWLKEGGAEYTNTLFEEWKNGHDAMVEFIKDNQKYVLEECHLQDNGFHPLSPMPDEEIYGRHTYYKGASIHHNLRAYLGDEMYRNACQALLSEYWDSYMDPDMFISALEDYSNMEIQPFFDAQVFQPGFSTWVIDSTSTTGDQASGFETTVFMNQKLRACTNFHNNEAIEIYTWNENWEATFQEVRVSGEYDIATIEHDEPFELIALNADGRLNQGRLDLTVAITEATGVSSLPWVEMRMGCDEITDSVIIRLEHHWAAPDQEPLDFYIDEVSGTHFWTVDGTWEDGIEGTDALLLDARFTYVGNSSEGLDYDLYYSTEANGFLAWRPNSAAPWEQYPDYTWQSGSLENGNGTYKVSNLRKGQYTFANGDISLNIDETPEAGEFSIFPNPASSHIDLKWAKDVSVKAISIYDSAGRCVKRASVGEGLTSTRVSVVDLASGNYVAVLMNGREVLGSNPFLVE
ncbi:MAG: M1 family aminopeptidase [bacterium]|nr:M1 family aminopeptidase [bacterium]